MLDHEWYCGRAEAEIARMASVVAGTDPATPVPTCPSWSVARLVKHTGIVHRWATHIVSTRSSERVEQRDVDAGLPALETGYPGWLADGAAPLIASLRSAGPDETVWAWGAEHRSGWWARRMLHETTVHRADAQIALDGWPDIDPVVAADGIEEFLANLPQARRPRENLGSLPAGKSMHLHATDADGEWLIRFADGTVTWSRGHEKATAAVRGPVAALLLFTYGRLGPMAGSLTVFGDSSVLDAWREKTALLWRAGCSRLVEIKPAGAGIAVGDQAREGGYRDLRRGPGTDVQADRAVHPRDVAWRHAERLKRRNVRGRVTRVAHHAYPPGLGGEGVSQHRAKLAAVMVGDDDVGALEVFRDRAGDGESRHLGACRAVRVGFHEQPSVTRVLGVPQQEPGHSRGEHGDQGALGGFRAVGVRAGDSALACYSALAVRDRAGVDLFSHTVSLLHPAAAGMTRPPCPRQPGTGVFRERATSGGGRRSARTRWAAQPGHYPAP
jgi:uncharacterized protein (TIGR03083 family)